jgi:hypothetical protein
VVAWGDDSLGQTNVPPFETNVTAIAAGANHSLAMLANGKVIGWGANNEGQTSHLLPGTIAIAAGGDQSLELRTNGVVYGWGGSDGPEPDSISNIVAIAAGAHLAMALLADGTLFAGWHPLPDFTTNVTAIAAGDDHSLALLADGSVVAWGVDYFGQSSVPPLTRVVAVSGGRAHSLALIGSAVSPGPPRFEILAPSLTFSNGQFLLRLTGLTGQGVTVITVSTNLLDWQPIYTNFPAAGTMDFVDPLGADSSERFYRAFEQR